MAWNRAVWIVGALMLLFSVNALPGGAVEPLTQPPCDREVSREAFAVRATQLENLVFPGDGTMVVSDLGADELLVYGPDGVLRTSMAVDALHGVTADGDGTLHAGVGVVDASGNTDWQLWRIDDIATGAHTVLATGLPAANGMAFDDAGDLYVSNPLGTAPPYLVRVPADDPGAWVPFGDDYGPNGLWYDAGSDTLVAAVTGDQSSPILRYDLATGQSTQVAALSFGAATLQPGVHAPHGTTVAVPKGLDDLTLGSDGQLYVVAHLTGEVLRVDPATGDACVLAAGLQEPTSLRFAAGFGAYDGDLFVTDMGGVGVTALVGPGAGTVWRIIL